MYKKLQICLQVVGCVTIGLLAVAGLLSLVGDASPVWAALGQESPSTSSSVSSAFNYQGMLRKPDGSVINGTYTMTFRLYDVPSGGTPLYAEEVQNVVVRDGLFTVLLGGGQSSIPHTAFQKTLYVGIQVDNDAEMQPRQRIAPVPYAVQLTDGIYVDEKGDVTVNGAVSTSLTIKDGQNDRLLLTSDEISTLDYNKKLYINKIHGDRTVLINANGGKVGIGTENPTATLHVSGTLFIEKKPIIFNRYNNLGDNVRHKTEYSVADYNCGIVGMRADGGDINEHSGIAHIVQAYMFQQDDTWWIRADFASDNPENWAIWTMCVDKGLSEIRFTP